MTVTRRLAAILAADCDEISETGLLVAQLGYGGRGRASLLCPGNSDINLLSDCQSVVDLDPEIANRAFDLSMTKQELNCTQITRPPVDQGRLRASERMGSE